MCWRYCIPTSYVMLSCDLFAIAKFLFIGWKPIIHGLAYCNDFEGPQRNLLGITRDVNTRVLGYPGPVWPTRVPWNQRSAQLPWSPSSKHWLPVWPHTGKYCIGCSRKRGAARVLNNVDNYCTRSTLSAAPRPPSLQSSLVCRRPVVNWPARTQCTRLFTSI